MTVKNTLLALLVCSFGAWAQTPTSSKDSGTFAPLPSDAKADTNRAALLQQALQNALAGKSPTVLTQQPPTTPTNVIVAPAPIVVVPSQPGRTALVPVPPAAETNRPAAPAGLPVPSEELALEQF